MFFTSILTFLFYTRYKGYSLYYLLFNLPGFNSLRSQTRIINVELILFGFAVAFISVLLFKYYKKYTVALFFVLISLITIDNYFKPTSIYRMDKASSQQRVELVTDQMTNIPERSIVSYQFKGTIDIEAYHQIDGMLAAQSMNLKAINGYSADIPEGFYHYFVDPSEESIKIWFDKKQFTADTVYVVTN